MSECHLPEPPVFSTVHHYPSICYLPPGSLLKLWSLHNYSESRSTGKNNGLEPGYRLFASQASDRRKCDNQLFTRYFFDIVTQQCYPFGAQNCGGNEKPIRDLVECQTMCRPSKEQL
uniref:BPTI/Kunitz inhibitor domain-containing protein n=1 Tax=Ditylenchus dipsaci TaxID=166011 RepID=A0A915E3D5_9BILA